MAAMALPNVAQLYEASAAGTVVRLVKLLGATSAAGSRELQPKTRRDALSRKRPWATYVTNSIVGGGAPAKTLLATSKNSELARWAAAPVTALPAKTSARMKAPLVFTMATAG